MAAKYPSRKAYQEAQRAALVARGERAIPAQYDNRGNCFTCGECGRCPGYHTEAEERASREKAREWMSRNGVRGFLPLT